MQVHSHLVHEVEAVAHMDEWSRIGQLGFDEELLHFLRVVNGTVATHSLHLIMLHVLVCDKLELERLSH